MGREQAGFHVTVPRRGYLGASFVTVDWCVRIFGMSDLVDKSSEHLSRWTIPLYGCMNRRPSYTSQQMEKQLNLESPKLRLYQLTKILLLVLRLKYPLP